MTKDKTPWYAGGLHFECMQCGRCCSGPAEGYIWVTKAEVKRIAQFLEMSVQEVAGRFLSCIGFRRTIIEDRITKDCIFLQEGKCVIYPVRPNQCRTWPFWAFNLISPDAWNSAAKRCNGLNRGKLYSRAEIEKAKNQKCWWADETK
ncbi:MAG: YkgJ family cysteine cluster protein [Planctomycetota bacterium]